MENEFNEWISVVRDTFPSQVCYQPPLEAGGYRNLDNYYTDVDPGGNNTHTWALSDGCNQAYTVKEFSTYEDAVAFSKIPVKDCGTYHWAKVCIEEFLYESIGLDEPIMEDVQDRYDLQGTRILTKQDREDYLNMDTWFPGKDKESERLKESYRKDHLQRLEKYREAIINTSQPLTTYEAVPSTALPPDIQGDVWYCREIYYWRFLEPYHFTKLLSFRTLLMDKDIFVLSYSGNGTWEMSHIVLLFHVLDKFVRLRIDLNGQSIGTP